MKPFILCTLTLIIFNTLGCANMLSQKKVKFINVSHLSGTNGSDIKSVMSIPADLRLAIIRHDAENNEVICTEPSPDVALSDSFGAGSTITSKITGNSTLPNITKAVTNDNSIDNHLNSSTTAVTLAGRSEAVLLARDMLYQNCIWAANGFLTKENVQSNFKEVLQVITDIAAKEKTTADTNAKLAEAAIIGTLDPKITTASTNQLNLTLEKAKLSRYKNCLKAAKSDAKKIDACDKAQLSD
ncbi:hypothetical protein [Acinetobacter baumannii]|uniref:Uncharacterized protein n=1 Tax=Acinetobacter baumannii TaxID=470 RepID=A0AAP1QV61_ACIBA|nr:hypothetical protein [Acinetobacter baumannii]MBD2849098.1 hypothetical protein [Acinetobacter baumannii]MBD3132782.1 hypothetical protein [Acinetobacter baumannii]MBE0306567.1 hypothetical protein [Acinetobacter baumannii]MBE0311873.1 hypothetical protein [Acinetobacter baumannii]MBE0329394.1 hypothetical protein [Acinetobacter baumannii]